MHPDTDFLIIACLMGGYSLYESIQVKRRDRKTQGREIEIGGKFSTDKKELKEKRI